MKDLRSFLEEWEEKYPREVCRIQREVSVKHEMTALAARLEKLQLFPILIFENPLSSSGEKLDVPVVTNLLAYAMPLIRFRLGDLCRFDPAPCPCGRGLPLLELVEGRTNDVIVLPDGRRISPQAVADFMVGFSARLSRFRVVQEAIDRVEVLIVPRLDAAHAAHSRSLA